MINGNCWLNSLGKGISCEIFFFVALIKTKHIIITTEGVWMLVHVRLTRRNQWGESVYFSPASRYWHLITESFYMWLNVLLFFCQTAMADECGSEWWRQTVFVLCVEVRLPHTHTHTVRDYTVSTSARWPWRPACHQWQSVPSVSVYTDSLSDFTSSWQKQEEK